MKSTVDMQDNNMTGREGMLCERMRGSVMCEGEGERGRVSCKM